MWQPIETAPRNQTFLAVLNCAGEQTICTMRWPVAEAKNSRPDSKTFHVERVTHWMPLPDLPGAQPAQSAPEGYMLLPIEPTEEMVRIATAEYVQACSRRLHPNIAWRRAFQAMLVAAPNERSEYPEAKP